MALAAPPPVIRPLGADMRDLGEFLDECTRQPEQVTVNVRVRGRTQEEKLADLEAIARDWGVRVGRMGDGTRIAEKRFGRARVEAHVSPQDRTLADYQARMAAARQARESETGAAA